MKKFIFLLIFVYCQISFARWEKTGWQSDPPFFVAARDGDRMMIIGLGPYSPVSIIKVSKDRGETWQNTTFNYVNDGIVRADVLGNTIILKVNQYIPSIYYISTDFGSTWIENFPGMPENSELSDYAIIGNKIIATLNGENGGPYISNDSGITWTDIHNGLPKGEIKSVISIGEKAITQIDTSFFLTSDYGATWQKKGGLIPRGPIPSRIIIKDDLIYKLPYGALLFSTNYGETWRKISEKLKNFAAEKMVMVSNQIVLASKNYWGDNHDDDRIFSTSDNGETWIERNNEPIKGHNYKELYANGDKLIVVKADSFYVSYDIGDTWKAYKMQADSAPVGSDFIYYYGAEAYNEFYNRIYKSIDSGFTWKLVHSGPYYGEVSDIATMDGDLYVATHGDTLLGEYGYSVYRSTDYGVTWKPLNIKTNYIYRLFAGDNKLLFTVYWDAFYSSDLGESWKTVKEVWHDNYFLDWAYFGPNGKIFTMSAAIGFSKSLWNGTEWAGGNNGLPYPWYWIRDFQVSSGFGDRDILYAQMDSMLYRTLNEGMSWHRIGEDLKINRNGKKCMEVYLNEIFLYSDDVIYYSSDYGDTWTERTGDLKLGEDNWVIAIKMVDNLVFLSTLKDGVFVSEDRGITWKQINDGLTNRLLYISKFAASGDYIFCGSASGLYGPDGDAIYRAKISDFLSAPDERKEPQSLTIFPNPAGDFISISNYRGSDRRFTVLNILGQEVLSGEFTGDRISVASLPPGAYNVRIGSSTGMMLKK
ncbi:MAG: T9SS type A sorting domain-containing protein [Chloroflexota bacterium]